MTGAFLVARARAGEAEAFAEIISAHEHELAVFLYRRVSDPHVAEDLLQDTFFAAWKAIRKTQPDLMVRPWLYKIALNMARQWERRQGIASRILQLWHRPRDEDDWVERNEVQRVLKQMQPQDAEILLLKIMAGFSYSEIGVTLGLKPEAVRQRLHRARERFRVLYVGQGDE
jgi:RNA polymerase sigma factor (sigma-70 family)